MRFSTARSALALGLVAPALAVPRSGRAITYVDDHQRAAAVKQAFEISWSGYKKYAFPHDDLDPGSNGHEDDRNAWGASAVDGLSTAIIMRETGAVNTILNYIPTINFTTTAAENDVISVFETTIRYLGGMIASYDLLTGPFSDLNVDPRLVDSLLTQSQTLADSLKITFDTPSGLSDGMIYLNPSRRISGQSQNNLAEAGTLVLEWTHLSDLLGDRQYARLAQKCEDYLLNPTGSPEAWPGLVGSSISTQTGQFVNSQGGWSGGADSFYEYLIKMYLYDPTSFGNYKDRWVLAANSTMAHLASHPTTEVDLTYLAQYDGQTIYPSSGHLASFAGGNFIMGGVLLGNQDYIDFGLNLAQSYYFTYVHTETGIGPEGFQWVDSRLGSTPNNSPPPANQVDFYRASGYWVTSGAYILRPETMESLYYSWRVTGDSQYRDMAWAGFLAINETCHLGSGYSSINDVNQPGGGGFSNNMQSFWLAEALKYMYLIFAEQDSPVQFQAFGPNHFVFNTEAQPIKVRHE